MKVKTKSGFTCDVNENKIKDWRYLRAAAKVAKSESQIEAVDGIGYMAEFLLGSKDLDRLIKHITDKEGVADAVVFENELKEISEALGEAVVKKSMPSQD